MSVNFRRYFFLLRLIHSVSSQGPARITFNKNPVYIGEPVTMTCSYGSGVALISITLDAFSGSHRVGYLWCNVVRFNTTGTGIFAGSNFTGCPSIPASSSSVSMLLDASPSFALDYNCSARVIDSNGDSATVTSNIESLVVFEFPAAPTFVPSPLTFDESAYATVACESRNGTPAAFVLLSVTSSSGRQITASQNSSALLVLPSPLTDWHNASATCLVRNHNSTNMFVESVVTINYVKTVASPAVFYTTVRNVALDCSTYIDSYPSVYYSWFVPQEANVTESSRLSSPVFMVFQGQTGWFNCTATNIVTQKSAMVVFAINECTSLKGCIRRRRGLKDNQKHFLLIKTTSVLPPCSLSIDITSL